MTVKFVQNGHSIDYTPGADVTAGDVVVQGDLVGVAKQDIKANVLGAQAVTGVFDFPKAAGDGGIAAGARCYWDVAEGVAKGSAEAGANKLIGKAVKAALTADTTVRVALAPGDAVTVTASPGANATRTVVSAVAAALTALPMSLFAPASAEPLATPSATSQ